MSIYIIPSLLFLLDFLLRVVLELDLIDVGADMALLAVATFAAILVDAEGRRSANTPISFMFFLTFLLPWIICLWLISSDSSFLITLGSLGVLDLRLLPSWLLGFAAFMLSGLLTNELV